MKKIQPIMALNTCEITSDNLNNNCHFGNGWGLFVEIDSNDTKHVNKYNCSKNTLETIIEEDDIEKNLQEIYVFKPNSPNKKRVCYKSSGCFSTLCVISLMAYFIICVI